jgi:hypothetical protein
MDVPNSANHSFSAEVRMHLSFNGDIHSIAQLGPDFLILADPVLHPPTDGEIFFSVDGHESRWIVHLPEGIEPSKRRTRIVSLVTRAKTGAAIS